MPDFDSIKAAVVNNTQAIYNNKPAFYSLIFVVIIVVLIMLVKKYNSIVKKEKMEPVFIRNVKKADQQIQVTDDLIPSPVGGSAFTYSTWLYVNNLSKGLNKFKHVFSKGDINFKSTSPGVWMLPNINSLAILMDTADRSKGSENIVEIKNKVPKNFNETGSKGSKIPNQTECTCKGFLTVDDTAQQAAYLNDTKECFIYAAPKELDDSNVGITWTKKNLNSSTMDPRINKQIINDDNNCIIVENIPLQRWFQLVIVANETALEVYIDGKLYKTSVLKSLPKLNAQPLYVNLDGGFDGMINELRYYPYALKYIDIYSMYARGPTPFYFMYLFKGKAELYEQKINNIKDTANNYLMETADNLYGYN
jgi:hypothetical protein